MGRRTAFAGRRRGRCIQGSSAALSCNVHTNVCFEQVQCRAGHVQWTRSPRNGRESSKGSSVQVVNSQKLLASRSRTAREQTRAHTDRSRRMRRILEVRPFGIVRSARVQALSRRSATSDDVFERAVFMTGFGRQAVVAVGRAEDLQGKNGLGVEGSDVRDRGRP